MAKQPSWGVAACMGLALLLAALCVLPLAAAEVAEDLRQSAEAAVGVEITAWDALHSGRAEDKHCFHVLVVCYGMDMDGLVALAAIADELHEGDHRHSLVSVAAPPSVHHLFEGTGVRLLPMCSSPFMSRTEEPGLLETWSIEGDLAPTELFRTTSHVLESLNVLNETPALLVMDTTALGAISAAELHRIRFVLNHAHTLSGIRSRLSRAMTPWTLPVLGATASGRGARLANSLLRSLLLVEDFLFAALNTNGHRKAVGLPAVSTSMSYTENAHATLVNSMYPLEMPRVFQLPFLLVGPVAFDRRVHCDESQLDDMNFDEGLRWLLVDTSDAGEALPFLAYLPTGMRAASVGIHQSASAAAEFTESGVQVLPHSGCAVAKKLDVVAALVQCDLTRIGQAAAARLPIFCLPSSDVDVAAHAVVLGAARMASIPQSFGDYLQDASQLSALRSRSRTLKDAMGNAVSRVSAADFIEGSMFGYPRHLAEEHLQHQNRLVFEYMFTTEEHTIGTIENGIAIYFMFVLSFATMVAASGCCCCCCLGRLLPCVRTTRAKQKAE